MKGFLFAICGVSNVWGFRETRQRFAEWCESFMTRKRRHKNQKTQQNVCRRKGFNCAAHHSAAHAVCGGIPIH
ncbi:MAG: hypothetical protein IKQ75_01900 [Bacteroidales bacterium]|nr:hypothetical protein [Bacteroidales bacterium]